MSTFVGKIEKKQNELQESLKKHQEQLNAINADFKKLRAQRKQVNSNISVLMGAINAFMESVNVAKDDEVQPTE